MNAINTNSDLSPEAKTSGVELLYTPAESIFGAAAPDMVANGWSVFPQQVDRRPGRVYDATIKWSEDHDLKNRRPTADAMDMWVLHCGTLNVAGVMGKASGDVFALDVDVTDESMAEEIRSLAYETLGYTPLQRVGMAPKLALFYRAAGGEMPANRTYEILESDTGKRTGHAIEIQSTGKLMTLHGRHHKTGRYYTWGDKNPATAGPEVAPFVTSGQLEAFVEAVNARFPLSAGSGRANASAEHGVYAKYEVNGKVREGEVANDGRNNILQSVLCKMLVSFDPDFWLAHEAGGEAWIKFRDAKVKATADGFANGTGGKKATPPSALTGRWAPHLLLQEIGRRFDSRVAYLLKEGKPVAEKMRKPREKKARANIRPEGDTRPVIRVEPGRISDAVDQAERALIASDRGIYQRGGQIVFIGSAPVTAADGSEIEAIKIIERGDYALAEDLSHVAVFERYDARAEDYTLTDTPMKIVKTLQDRVGQWRLNVLSGHISAPTLRPDGSLLDVEGYDKATGLVYNAQGREFPQIPEAPTQQQAVEALGILKALIGTFPYVSDEDRSVVLSMLLTACIRRNLPTAPLHGISATTPGSGKSKLADLASLLATGRRAGVVNQAADASETEKRIASFLIAGAGQVAIDNVNAPLDGDLLNSMLTQTSVSVRILGQSATPELPTNVLVTVTGNNLVVVGDLARRSLLCRLDAGCERPENRVFENDPVADAIRDRGALVAAALTVLRAYFCAGRPAQKPPLGSFEVWSRTVRDALLWLGEADPVATQEALRAQDPKLDAMNNLFAQWSKAFPGSRITVSEVIERATETVIVNGRPELKRKALFEAISAVAGNGGALNPNRLGRWLTAHAGRIVDGCRILRDGERHKVALWRLELLNGGEHNQPQRSEETTSSQADYRQAEASGDSRMDTRIAPHTAKPQIAFPRGLLSDKGPRVSKADAKATEYARHMAEQRAQH